jgi:hypothetical protein
MKKPIQRQWLIFIEYMNIIVYSANYYRHYYTLSKLWPLIYARESTFEKCK